MSKRLVSLSDPRLKKWRVRFQIVGGFREPVLETRILAFDRVEAMQKAMVWLHSVRRMDPKDDYAFEMQQIL